MSSRFRDRAVPGKINGDSELGKVDIVSRGESSSSSRLTSALVHKLSRKKFICVFCVRASYGIVERNVKLKDATKIYNLDVQLSQQRDLVKDWKKKKKIT